MEKYGTPYLLYTIIHTALTNPIPYIWRFAIRFEAGSIFVCTGQPNYILK